MKVLASDSRPDLQSAQATGKTGLKKDLNMPDFATHYYFGQKVLSDLPEEIPVDPDVFDFALSGPDDWFFCFTNIELCARGRVMHRNRTGSFLRSLAQEPSLFSYFSGFFCHYALDTICHPYIIVHTGTYDLTPETRKYRGNHTALEHAIDCLILQQHREERPLAAILSSCPLPKNLELPLNRVYQNVYGWKHVFPDLLTAKRKMCRYLRILEDPYGLAKTVTNVVRHPLLRPLPYSRHYYESEDILNLSHRQWHHPKDPTLTSTSSFPELIEQARSEAVRVITAVSQGDLSMIGNRSYITGLDLEDERNQAQETYLLFKR